MSDPGFIPFDTTGRAAFDAAIAAGSSPEDAYYEACMEMTQLAQDNGMPLAGWVADMMAAGPAFGDALDAGMSPGEAFDASRAAGGEAAAAWAAENAPEEGAEPPEPPPSDGEPPGFIPFDETGREVFNEAIADGATPMEAFVESFMAMTDLAQENGMPYGGWISDLLAAGPTFQAAIESGESPEEAFDASRAAGGEAAAAWAAEYDGAGEGEGAEGPPPPPMSPEMMGMLDGAITHGFPPPEGGPDGPPPPPPGPGPHPPMEPPFPPMGEDGGLPPPPFPPLPPMGEDGGPPPPPPPVDDHDPTVV